MNKVKVKHAGSCHCGAVKFEVYAPVDLDVVHCRLLDYMTCMMYRVMYSWCRFYVCAILLI